METIVVKIKGLRSAACVSSIEYKLQQLEYVEAVHVDFVTSEALIRSFRKLDIDQIQKVVEENGYFHVAGEEILAGAWFQQNRCVEYLTTSCGVAFEDAWKLSSTIPAALLGIDLPNLSKGSEATFVVYNNDKIEKTIFRGEQW